jgi:glycosyltransferase involved in cell wall biosynthesis
MKIAYFIDHLRGDGAQRYLTQLAIGLAQNGHQQTVLCLNDSYDASLVKQLDTIGIQVCVIGKGSLLTGRGLVSTWYRLRREQFQVAVTFLFFADILGRSLARTAGVPHVVSSIQNRNIGYKPWQRLLCRFTMRWVDGVVLNSAHVRSFAITEEGAPANRITVIPNAIHTEDYCVPVDRSDVLDELGLAADQPVIGCVGRLTYQKGFDVLLEALSRLKRSDLQLLVVGTGELEGELQAQTEALGLARQVRFVGYRRDIPRLLNVLDLYVQPSRHEGMPNALLEAMASGRPIVASAVDGNCELIQDGIDGWLVPPENAAALSNAIQTALSDKVEAQRRGRAARQHAELFTVEHLVTSWETLLMQVAGAKNLEIR